jgi:hypothetical protein
MKQNRPNLTVTMFSKSATTGNQYNVVECNIPLANRFIISTCPIDQSCIDLQNKVTIYHDVVSQQRVRDKCILPKVLKRQTPATGKGFKTIRSSYLL